LVEVGMVDVGAAVVSVLTEFEVSSSPCFVEDGMEEVGAKVVSGFAEVETTLEGDIGATSLLAELPESVLVAAGDCVAVGRSVWL
jgi:hypothetical protein